MIISNITPPQVWSASSRSLTNIGSSALASTGAAQTSLAANTTVSLVPSAGTVGLITLGAQTGSGATGQMQISITDGPHGIQVALSAAGSLQPTSYTMVNTNVAGLAVKNTDATVAGNYISAAWVFTI